MHGSKYDYCPECQEAEMELLSDVHFRHDMKELEEFMAEEFKREKQIKDKGSNVI